MECCAASTLHIDKFASAVQSGFDLVTSSLVGTQPMRVTTIPRTPSWHSGYPDAEVRLDPHTFREVPWDNKVPFSGDFVDAQGAALPICPRQLLKKACWRD